MFGRTLYVNYELPTTERRLLRHPTNVVLAQRYEMLDQSHSCSVTAHGKLDPRLHIPVVGNGGIIEQLDPGEQ